MATWAFFRRKLSGVRRYSAAELALVPVALVLLGCARLAIAVLPLRAYRSWLGHPATEFRNSKEHDARADSLARAIGRTVRATATVAPWRADCLPQAMAAAALLRSMGIAYRLSIGWTDEAAKLDDGPMLAHAWIESGDRIVTGAPLEPALKPRLVFEA